MKSARYGTDHAHAHRALQAQRASEGHHQLALMNPVRVAELEKGQAGLVDLHHREINVAVQAPQLGLDELALRPHGHGSAGCLIRRWYPNLNASRTLYHMGVGDDV